MSPRLVSQDDPPRFGQLSVVLFAQQAKLLGLCRVLVFGNEAFDLRQTAAGAAAC
jgi:hypothetical protein